MLLACGTHTLRLKALFTMRARSAHLSTPLWCFQPARSGPLSGWLIAALDRSGSLPINSVNAQ